MNNLFEFHCHTEYSRDGGAKIKEIIELYEKRGISGLAVTDHSKIAGALEFKKIAPEKITVIIGEEINTLQGEIIGLFLNTRIEPGLPLAETILKIKNQGGLVILPHPFDRLRSKRISKENIEKNLARIDIIETFNARCVFSSDNKKAEEFAIKNNKPSICGSDAHFIKEYGKTLMQNINPRNPQEFLQSLEDAQFITKKTPFHFHLMTKYRKLLAKKRI